MIPTNSQLASCISGKCKSRAPAPPVSARRIGSLKKGELTKYGYVNVVNMTKLARHRALMRAMRGIAREKGVSLYAAGITLVRKLNAVYVYTRRTNPNSSEIFLRDRKWVSDSIKKLKNKK
tara:strand:- start:793 stop:1155 length:363 start_codon:yes stop_codon:yes gene_type:complete